MDPFELPAELPTGADELGALRTAAQAAYSAYRAHVEGGGTLSDAQVENLRFIVQDALPQIESAITALSTREADITALLEQGAPAPADPAPAPAPAEPPAPADPAPAPVEPELVTAGAPPARRSRTRYAGTGNSRPPELPRPEREVGFRMDPSAPRYVEGLVGFRELALSIDSVKPGTRARSGRPGPMTDYVYQTLYRMDRELVAPGTEQELVAAIEAATAPEQLRSPVFAEDGSLTAAGGWCAPSETLYDFCEVPTATDLISLPEITINRGGVRWPQEPDLSAIFDSFEFFFTEPELEAEDGEGNPTAVKNCVSIPCPDEFEEIRLAVVGYCVEAGILQRQGWPELIEWFMRSLTQEHFRSLSRRTILDMVAGSTPVLIPAASQIATASSVLNSIELMAVNLRLQKGLGRTALIEGVAPVWLHNVIRADLANQQGVDTKAITDAQINGWFSLRNISFQFVGDWQTRGVGQPGHLGTTEWPGTVRVLLYPAGTWFRALDPVIQFGVLYPRELLQVNRYTQMFTEDSIAIGKRCNESLVVTIPIVPNGMYGQPGAITANAAANEVQSITITGTPTGGTFQARWQGQPTGDIAYNATAANVKSALDALSNLDVGDTAAAGGPLPGTPVTVTFQGRYASADVPKIQIIANELTGGTNPAVNTAVTTEGGS